MVERVQALESEEYGFKPQFFCVIALCPLASHLTSELPASLLKWGWYLHQKTTVRTKCDSTTYLRIELLIVTYVCQFFPSRGRHKGTYFIPSFQCPLNLEIWSPKALFLNSDVYIGNFLLEVSPEKAFWSQEEFDPSLLCIPSPGSQKVPERNDLLSPEE